MEERGKRYFLENITTTKCRRLVWNKYFGNQNKKASQVLMIALVGERKLKSGHKGMSSPEVEVAARKKLEAVREQIVAREYPNQYFLTGHVILRLTDDVLDVLAKRAPLVTSVETLQHQTRWVHAPQYGSRVVATIQEVLVDFPDLAALERETQNAERARKTLDAAAFKELQLCLVLVFEGCYNAVFSETELDDTPPSGAASRKQKTVKPPRRRCQIFLKLPRRDAWANFYEVIKEPISMSNIKTLSEKPTHYTSISVSLPN
ncbi:hypothetical protein C8R45DRAFT_1115134 [Mycena sanguinolenta]|nr:hypothetical protein C8R45DRAFT_1115134 [Mycena sanguinolenta]